MFWLPLKLEFKKWGFGPVVFLIAGGGNNWGKGLNELHTDSGLPETARKPATVQTDQFCRGASIDFSVVGHFITTREVDMTTSPLAKLRRRVASLSTAGTAQGLETQSRAWLRSPWAKSTG